MTQEEKKLFDALRERELRGDDPFEHSAMDVAETVGVSIERAHEYCEKWADRGWWHYGTRPLFGRVTEAGMAR